MPSPPTSSTPAVSVVMATYNRSNIIGHAIESVRRGSFADWELVVVGDACTDDTEAVVAAIGDPRIRFVNLPENCGEQSGPNNVGVKLARGRYLAFLNHDDLWFPEHLARSVAVLNSDPAADLVFGVGLLDAADDRPMRAIGAVTADKQYHPSMFLPATMWVMRRELAERVGPWTPAAQTRLAPSQDWLQRARKAGARLAGSDHFSAVMIASATRANAYRDRHGARHAEIAASMREPDFLVHQLLCASLTWEDPRVTLRAAPFFAEGVRIAVRKTMARFGMTPPSPRYWLLYWRKGAFVRALRKARGLPPHSRLP